MNQDSNLGLLDSKVFALSQYTLQMPNSCLTLITGKGTHHT